MRVVMHEFSLCQGIIKQVLAANHNNLSNVSEVIVDIGEFAGVDIASLCFWFPVVAKDASAPEMKLRVNTIAGVAKCEKCMNEFSVINLYSPCPKCNEFGSYALIHGNELLIKSYVLKET